MTTREPWNLTTSGNGLEIQGETGTPGHARQVCRIPGQTPEDYDNARLLLEAPKMAATLQRLQHILYGEYDGTLNIDKEWDGDVLDALGQLAQEAGLEPRVCDPHCTCPDCILEHEARLDDEVQS